VCGGNYIMRSFMICNPHQICGDKFKKNNMCGHVACMGERGTYRFLMGRPKGKRHLGRPRHRWEDNFKIDLL
jgi:hypothetical protein